MKFSSIISFLFCLLYLPINAIGEESTNPYLEEKITTTTIDQADWDKAIQGLDYGEGKQEIIKPQEPIANADFLATLFKILGFIGVAVLIVFLLRYFVGLQGLQKSTNKKFDPNAKIDTQTVAEHIHEFDLPTLIQQAIDKKEYSVATRLYYLLSIKTLSEKQLIKWKKDKTNRNYLNELSGFDLKNNFRELTNIFERVWYGEVAIDAPIFRNIEGQFKQFIGNIAVENGG